MTDEQKRRKLEELEQFLLRSDSAVAEAPGTFSGLTAEEARVLAVNLRRQLSGEADSRPAAYHVSRRKTGA